MTPVPSAVLRVTAATTGPKPGVVWADTAEKRADYVREALLVDLSDVRTVVREIENGTYPMIPAEVATKIRQLESAFCYATAYKDEPPVPYTDPRDGDEVEIVLRARVDGRTIAQPAAYCQPRGFFDGRHFADLIAAGCVTLVKAAAPQYQPGRIYRSPAGTLYRRSDLGNWHVFHEDGTITFLAGNADDALPALEPMDLVPAQVSP